MQVFEKRSTEWSFSCKRWLVRDLSEFTQQDGWKKRLQNARVWQTWQGYYLRVLSLSSLSNLCFRVFYKKISLKESEVWRKVISKQRYCHACHTRFAVFLPLPSCFVSSLLRYEDISWSWIPKSLIQVKKEKENFVVACFRCMMLHETIRNDDF